MLSSPIAEYTRALTTHHADDAWLSTRSACIAIAQKLPARCCMRPSIFRRCVKIRHESQVRKSKLREAVTVFVIAPSRRSLLRENRLTKRELVVVDASGQPTYRPIAWIWQPLFPLRGLQEAREYPALAVGLGWVFTYWRPCYRPCLWDGTEPA